MSKDELVKLMKGLEFVDDNNLLGEISNEEFKKKALEIVTHRDEKAKAQGHDWHWYGSDGFIATYEKKYSYKGLKFSLFVLRYFHVKRDDLGEVEKVLCKELDGHGCNELGKHATIEYEPKDETIIKIAEGLKPQFYSEFLWLDSLHANMEKWTLRQQIEWILGEVVWQLKTIQ